MFVASFAGMKGGHLTPRPSEHHRPRRRSVTHIRYPYGRKIPLGLVVGELPCKRRVLAVSLQDAVGPGPRSMFGAPPASLAPTASESSSSSASILPLSALRTVSSRSTSVSVPWASSPVAASSSLAASRGERTDPR